MSDGGPTCPSVRKVCASSIRKGAYPHMDDVWRLISFTMLFITGFRGSTAAKEDRWPAEKLWIG